MANKNASVSIELEGRGITLALNLNTISELGERFATNDLASIMAGFASGVRWAELRKLLYCLASDDETLTEREVGRLIGMEDIPRVMTALEQLMGGKPADPRVLAPFVPTPAALVKRMLEAAGCGPGKIVLDLGAGDGRVLEQAAEMGAAEVIGYELDPGRASAIRNKGLRECKVFMVDAAEAVVNRADIVFLYLLQSSNQKLRGKLERELKPGAVVVSHAFSMDGWPSEVSEAVECADGIARRFHLWSIDVVREALKIEPAAA